MTEMRSELSEMSKMICALRIDRNGICEKDKYNFSDGYNIVAPQHKMEIPN
jgi:hypothetical protein